MKNTDLEIMPETLSQPTRITRRSFVKRTGSTVIVTVLALEAFRSEALADTPTSPHKWILEYQGGLVGSQMSLSVGNVTGVDKLAPTVVYTVTVDIDITYINPTALPSIGDRQLDWQFHVKATMKATPPAGSVSKPVTGPVSESTFRNFLATENTDTISTTGSTDGGEVPGKIGELACSVTSVCKVNGFKITAGVTAVPSPGTPSTPIDINLKAVDPTTPKMKP